MKKIAIYHLNVYHENNKTSCTRSLIIPTGHNNRVYFYNDFNGAKQIFSKGLIGQYSIAYLNVDRTNYQVDVYETNISEDQINHIYGLMKEKFHVHKNENEIVFNGKI
jgi:hypothetical protein